MLTLDFDRWGGRPGELVLDLGCGAGRHTFEALLRGLKVVSADVNLAPLKEAADTVSLLTAGRRPAPHSLFTQADACALPFTDGAFDLVIASEVLEHVVADRDALAEIGRVLKPGGSLAVTVPRWWPERVCWALSRRYHSVPGGHVRIYRAPELISKLREAGFEVVDTHFSHALHSPYWWLKCLFGIDNDTARVPALYHRFLVWDLMNKPRAVRALERILNPILGKSLVLYASKVAAPSTSKVAA